MCCIASWLPQTKIMKITQKPNYYGAFQGQIVKESIISWQEIDGYFFTLCT